MSFEDFEAQSRAPPPAGRGARPHRRSSRVRDRADRRATAATTGSSCSRTARTRTAPPGTGAAPGTFGDAGVYSFYATKTVSTRRGRRAGLGRRRACSTHARAFRDYGKPDHAVAGLNFRMSEFTAALALVQTERLEEIVALEERPSLATHLDPLHPHRLRAARRHGLGALQVHRVPPDRALDRQGLRRAVPPPHGHPRRSAEHRLGGGEPLVRPALLPARRHEHACSSPAASGFIGSHVVDRLAAAGPPAAHPGHARVPWHDSAEVETVHRRRPPPRRRAARRATDARRSATWRRPRTSRRSTPSRRSTELNARGTLDVLEAARRARDRSRRLRLDGLGLLRRRRGRGRRGHAAAPAGAPLHGRQARRASCTAAPTPSSMACESTIVRFGIPYGPRARPAAVIPSFIAGRAPASR